MEVKALSGPLLHEAEMACSSRQAWPDMGTGVYVMGLVHGQPVVAVTYQTQWSKSLLLLRAIAQPVKAGVRGGVGYINARLGFCSAAYWQSSPAEEMTRVAVTVSPTSTASFSLTNRKGHREVIRRLCHWSNVAHNP